jgi:hypothetical protein
MLDCFGQTPAVSRSAKQELQDFIGLGCCAVMRTGIALNVILTLERDRRTAGMWQAKSKPQAIVVNERLEKVRFH